MRALFQRRDPASAGRCHDVNLIHGLSCRIKLSEEDFRYTWDRFQGVRDLYNRAAKASRYVLFTAAK
jgi:hypothetical protein